eukprot:4997112-Prymnesium_polylepis.1
MAASPVRRAARRAPAPAPGSEIKPQPSYGMRVARVELEAAARRRAVRNCERCRGWLLYLQHRRLAVGLRGRRLLVLLRTSLECRKPVSRCSRSSASEEPSDAPSTPCADCALRRPGTCGRADGMLTALSTSRSHSTLDSRRTNYNPTNPRAPRSVRSM